MIVAAVLAAHLQTLHLQDLRRTISVLSPQISPDGRSIALLLRRSDFEKDRSLYDLVLVDVATRRTRMLVKERKTIDNVAWSPDGTRLAYIAPDSDDEKAQPQIYVLPMNGGEPVQMTREEHGVDAFDWRPDGAAIAYSVSVPANEKAVKAHKDEFAVVDEPWTAQSAPPQTRMYEVDLQGGKSRRIGPGNLTVGGGFTYARDGRALFVTRVTPGFTPEQFAARQIVRIDTASGKATKISSVSSLQAEPLRALDGRIAFTAGNPNGLMQSEVAVADSYGARAHIVTRALDRNVTGATFAPDGALIVAANDATQRKLFRVTPAGAVHVLPVGSLSVSSSPSISHNGVVAFTAAAPDHPSEVFVLAAGANAPVRLTNYNAWVSHYHLGATTCITWRTHDGLMADGVITAPPGWRRGMRAPLVVYIHGGPTAASTTAFAGFAQVLAAHGWFVFQPNYRGSDNLGLRYARTTVPHITSVPGSDIELGLAQALRQYPIDASRIGVSGWSEGGLLTSWLITHDRRWRTAVSGAAVNDWAQYGALTDAKDFTPIFMGPAPWTSADEQRLYASESPLTYASNVRTPTLILSDAGDYRVPTPLSYEFYHEIRATGTPVQFVIYPVIGHFPRDPVRSEDVNRRWEAWLAKYL